MSQTNQATNPVSDSQRGIQYRVLIVEDDADIRELIRYNLAQEGFVVEEAADGAQALELVKRRIPDLMVLDLMLPGMPGLQICRQMRVERETAHLPILIVTAKGTEVDKVLGLEMGADDYVVKPFSPRELVARVRAVLRRAPGADLPSALAVGDLTLDPARRCAVVAGREVVLTGREFRLLTAFARAPGLVLSREELVRRAFGDEFDGYDRTVDVHIANLRKKLEADPGQPVRLVTVFGAGYRLDPR